MVPDEFGHFSEYREVTGTPRGVYGPYWALGERQRGSGGAPSFLLFSLSLPSLLLLLGKGGILLPMGVGLPRARHSRGLALPSSTPLYTGEGEPHRHTS